MQQDAGGETIFERAHAWATHDPDPETQAEIRALITSAKAGDSAALAQLHDAFDRRLSFGTAGLRGAMGGGPRRMNRVVVAQSSLGLAAYLRDRANAGTTTHPPSVVIGFDARKNSRVFAQDAAEVFAGTGLHVFLFDRPVPTPVTAFAVRELAASAGVMITASHNPPQDNGYKVYLGDTDGGAQIVPPADRDIAQHIAAVAEQPFTAMPRSTSYTVIGQELADRYVTRVAASLSSKRPTEPATIARATDQGVGADTSPPLRVVYTAMHGVGAEYTRRVLRAAGLPTPMSVPEQEQPDGTFPTLEFPNPEEPGALDRAYRLAAEHQAPLVIANDPDADRLGVAALCTDERTADDATTSFRRLTGNEIGLLLGWRAAQRAHDEGRSGVLANTIVSSPALGAVAQHYGFEHVETLSGSKWLARIPNLIFGYEEALGYLVQPGVVGDKDGIAAAAEMIALAQDSLATSRTLWQLLDQASMTFGHFASRQIVMRFAHADEARSVSERIRTAPPSSFAECAVTQVRDYRTPGLAAIPANVLAYDLTNRARVMIRPSGTEPKLKVYIDAHSDQGSLADRRALTNAHLDRIEASVRRYLSELLS